MDDEIVEITEVIGKTIKDIKFPNELHINGVTRNDENIQFIFTDGTILNLASWDYEGYSSGIFRQIIKPK